MADWYVSSVGYTAVAQFQISHAYTVGQIVRQLAAPAVGSERCFRCTTAGTSGGAEAAWNLGKGVTTTQGTAVFTECTGNSTQNWAAPAARLLLMFNTFSAAGDRIFVAHNHAETQAAVMTLTSVGASANPTYVYCVSSAGSVPPVAADLATTGSVATTGANNNINISGFFRIEGLIFSAGDAANVSFLVLLNSAGVGQIGTFVNCSLKLNTTSATAAFIFCATGQPILNLINTPLTFGATAQGILKRIGTMIWKNTPSAIAGTTPTTLFLNDGSASAGSVLVEGVDLSAFGSGKTLVASQGASVQTFAFLNCKLGASVTVAATPLARQVAAPMVINSDSGATGYRQQIDRYEGQLTAETTFVRTGGPSDGGTPISWKVVTTANALPLFPFECFQIPVWNTVTGSVVTATIEIESTATLTNADVWMLVEYLGTSGQPVASVVSSGVATSLTAAANLSTSSATWAGGLGSAVKQYLQVTFTPQLAGLVRATVFVGKASQTVYIDPKLTLS